MTAAQHPEGTADDALLARALRNAGVQATFERWDSDSTDWAEYDLAVLRSTWDYHLKFGRWQTWIDRVSRTTALWNPAELVRWNSHKSYLVELGRRDPGVVPTALLRHGGAPDLQATLQELSWDRFVLKPAVGANAYGFFQGEATLLRAAEKHLQGLLASGDVLLQPYLSETQALGERSMVFFEGKFSHAVRYDPVPTGGDRNSVDWTPTNDEVASASDLLRKAPSTPLYGRLDFLPRSQEEWLLGEMELIEPELFLRTAPLAAGLFADAIIQRLAR